MKINFKIKYNRTLMRLFKKCQISINNNSSYIESIGLTDHCWKEGGNKVIGPGLICWIIIFLIGTSTLVNFLAYNEYIKIGLTRNQILFRYFMLTIHSILLATFVYSMCKRCRGYESILILILVSIIQVVLTMAPFFGKIHSEINKLEGGNKIKSYIESMVQ